ncbi:TPA: Tol-Pal system beta propeller repeat protein TolB [Legionella pneumophila]|uniref:Tol-Pal system beta propeller repeat protein TolB n=2 Tax=Gammaproteobacteria TaxID=1236 RepID=UPI00048B595F|nr:Tol-Pal system beta propeller repeat protein TolB [Legionella pneumophila]RYB41669.1 Tol-Pal system beta propeller repeat protein TolB [Legionella pneumophila]RYW30916.1 Tol-Pal system beta propeller repeat protein TolB [Legionella pneumophila]HAT1866490.1 Tol-Pal system beta propeller repeat protein TolB [Legionella pneumophila]HAT1906617.1 Tol-Pal system beta propeller repeat protein TolB [Legionella pneumophila]HAT1915647.1 Tol-Pal system beta propeller repeat protein TolB [Legionella pn
MLNRIISLFLLLFTGQVIALDLELTQGINSALPIAINSFGSDTAAKEIGNVIENDLTISGQFKIISGPQGANAQSSVSTLRQLGADSVVTGRVNQVGNRIEVSFTLADAVANGNILLTKTFQINANQVRALAHHISDEVYQKLTGERGIFSTRIAYISVQRSGGRSRYSLEVADADGHNPQSLLVSSEPIMSPSWSPNGKSISYVSFEKKKAEIFTVSVETGQRRLITSFPGINGAPAWSPDGRHLAVVLSKSGTPKIYDVDLSSGTMKQLTFGNSIDTEPRYSPDGRSLLFTSGRGGSPQVYRLSLADGQISRVTFEGNYNARASYTPDMKHIVMLHREDRQFNIGVQNTGGGPISNLTFSGLDESPSVSPNSRLVLYATRYQDRGVLGIVSIDGRIRMRLPAREGDVQEPAWSPYLS